LVAGGFHAASRGFFQLSGGTLACGRKVNEFRCIRWFGARVLELADYPRLITQAPTGEVRFRCKGIPCLHDGFSCDFAHCEVETHTSGKFRNFQDCKFRIAG
jgi:hypothetical protein